jgi:hypothetical protein
LQGVIKLRASTLVSAPVTEIISTGLHLILLTLTDLPDLIYDLPSMGINLGNRVLDENEVIGYGVVMSRYNFGNRNLV